MIRGSDECLGAPTRMDTAAAAPFGPESASGRNALLAAGIVSTMIGAVIGGHANNPGPPGPRLLHSRRPIPILMYHAIAPAPAGAEWPQLFVKPIRFRAQMEYLAGEGYTAVTLDQVYGAWEKDGLVPPKAIVISFDDGYRGDYTDALPTLADHDWPGVLNLKLGALEDGELTERMIEEMLSASWELDSHTISHPDLTTMQGASLTEEVAGSRQMLQDEFGVPVNFFCYPSGRFNPRVVREVREAGYLGATTTQPGLASCENLYKLRRIRMEQRDSVRSLAAKLGRAAG